MTCLTKYALTFHIARTNSSTIKNLYARTVAPLLITSVHQIHKVFTSPLLQPSNGKDPRQQAHLRQQSYDSRLRLACVRSLLTVGGRTPVCRASDSAGLVPPMAGRRRLPTIGRALSGGAVPSSRPRAADRRRPAKRRHADYS